MIAPQIRPSPSVAPEPVDERNPSAVDLVAELREQRGQHGERAEHRDGDDRHGRDGEGREGRVAGEEHPGHRDQDRQPGNEHRPARRRRGSLERSFLAATRGTLLALALQVEHRVVDAHGEPDQQDERRDAVGHGQDLAPHRDETHRREHRREPEQERDAGRDEGAEGDEEDDQRQRERQQPRLLQVFEERLLDILARARADGPDEEAGMGALDFLHAVDDRVDLVDRLVGLARDLQLDEDRVLVVRDLAGVLRIERRFDLRDHGDGSDTLDDVLHRRLERRIRRRELAVLDQDASPAGCLKSS